MIKKLGYGALIGMMDLKSAFRVLSMFPGEFPLLGIKLAEQYYIDKWPRWDSMYHAVQWKVKR